MAVKTTHMNISISKKQRKKQTRPISGAGTDAVSRCQGKLPGEQDR